MLKLAPVWMMVEKDGNHIYETLFAHCDDKCYKLKKRLFSVAVGKSKFEECEKFETVKLEFIGSYHITI